MGDSRRGLIANERVHGLARLGAVAWTVASVVFLWMPPPETPSWDWPWIDEATHAGLFAVACALWSFAAIDRRVLAVSAVALAAISEIGQGLMPWPRHPDVSDFLFDVLGAALGMLAARTALWLRLRHDASGRDQRRAQQQGRNGRDSNPR